jgi:hypothetical protein
MIKILIAPRTRSDGTLFVSLDAFSSASLRRSAFDLGIYNLARHVPFPVDSLSINKTPQATPLHTPSLLVPPLTMSVEFETPSKPLANSLSTIGLSSPETKVSSANLASKLAAAAAKEDSKVVDKKQNTAAEDDAEAKALAEIQAQPLEEYRTRFVGEVDLPESEEPLLKETKSRFVLFPIKYREVSSRLRCRGQQC